MTYFDMLVLHSQKVEAQAAFYGALGVEFEKHSHGSGPEHYAAAFGNQVFELYPSEEGDSVMLRFPVRDVDAAVAALEAIGVAIAKPPAHTAWGYRAVVYSPSGHKILVTGADTIEAPVPPRVVSIAAIDKNTLLLVKKGDAWIPPGGKVEPGESDAECLKREFLEELPRSFLQIGSPFGKWRAISPSKGMFHDCYVYFGRVTGSIEPAAEISEARFVPNGELDGLNLSDATTEFVESLRFTGRLQ